MKKFIVSLLTYLGYGVNGVVPTDEKLFVGRLSSIITDMAFGRTDISDKGFTMIVKHLHGQEGKDFAIRYTYADGTRRIAKMEVFDVE